MMSWSVVRNVWMAVFNVKVILLVRILTKIDCLVSVELLNPTPPPLLCFDHAHFMVWYLCTVMNPSVCAKLSWDCSQGHSEGCL